MSAAPFVYRRRIEFRETDAAGIAHFSAFFAYAEEAEHALLRSEGLSVLMRDAEGPISWPRVAVKADFQGAVHFEDELDIAVTVVRLGTKSVTYQFQCTHAGRQVATIEITAVCCRLFAGQSPKGIRIPVEIAEKLRTHLTSVG